MNLKRLGGKDKCNVSAVKDLVTSRLDVQTNKKDIVSGTENQRRINKITVNLNQSVNAKDASVNAKVGLGGKMINSKVLLDSGADFSCVRNGAVRNLFESGVKLAVHPVRDPEFSGVAANNAPISVIGELNLDIEFKLVSGEEVLLNWTFVVVDDLNFD